MYNTYDVHFYASFALAMHWPLLELSLQRDIGLATLAHDESPWEIFYNGKVVSRKARGAVPHDVGTPGEDPWFKVNSYCIQDISRWKDLPSKFVLQVYRDYVATGNLKFVSDLWNVIEVVITRAASYDTDGDGVVDNEGFPDQTYDTWSATGCSAYSGGLWVAALSAAAKMAELLGHSKFEKLYTEMYEKARDSYDKKLWNGKYYKYDCSSNSHHDSIMADQLAGEWYARACDLPSIVPPSNAQSALKTVFEYNVKMFGTGDQGAVNGMKPNGDVDSMCMQSVEVWTGTSYAVAAAMLQEGLMKECFETARGVINSTYERYGYQFQTPEAWDESGGYRSAAYMRPLAIWAIQWAWEKLHRD
jgi:non-lysosomal glucosylceramidase